MQDFWKWKVNSKANCPCDERIRRSASRPRRNPGGEQTSRRESLAIADDDRVVVILFYFYFRFYSVLIYLWISAKNCVRAATTHRFSPSYFSLFLSPSLVTFFLFLSDPHQWWQSNFDAISREFEGHLIFFSCLGLFLPQSRVSESHFRVTMTRFYTSVRALRQRVCVSPVCVYIYIYVCACVCVVVCAFVCNVLIELSRSSLWWSSDWLASTHVRSLVCSRWQ